MHDRHTEGNNTGITLLKELTIGKTVAGIIFEVCRNVKLRRTDGRMVRAVSAEPSTERCNVAIFSVPARCKQSCRPRFLSKITSNHAASAPGS